MIISKTVCITIFFDCVFLLNYFRDTLYSSEKNVDKSLAPDLMMINNSELTTGRKIFKLDFTFERTSSTSTFWKRHNFFRMDVFELKTIFLKNIQT